jgi:hypothetical protein
MIYGLDILKSKGMTSVYTAVDDLNPTKAKKFYEKCGFSGIGKNGIFLKSI